MLAAKLSAAFLLFVLVSVEADIPAELLPAIEECAKEHGVNIESIKAKAHEEIPEDKKCVYKCMAVKIGVMSEDGVPDFTKLKALLETHNASAEKINRIDKCSDIKFDDPCDTARALCKCMKGH